MIFSMNWTPRTGREGFAVTLSLLAVFGCSQPASAGTGAGVLETSAGPYAFTPVMCAIYTEDGVDDIEVGGPGTAPDGEEFYFQLSSTGNELTVDLGVSGPFASADRNLRAGRYVSQEFVLEVMGRTMIAPSLVLVDQSGNTVDDDAILTLDCGG